jgi:hypothetical protein
MSTVLEFMGILRSPEGELQDRSVCSGTELLPSLSGKYWPLEFEEEDPQHITMGQQISIRRQRLRIEILGPETDADIKFELFQRLNTGGANLSEQEIRNCIVISINGYAYNALMQTAANADFISLTSIGDERRRRQYAAELVVRFIVMRHVIYTSGIDLHEYLDKGIVALARQTDFDWDHERQIFSDTIARLKEAVGDNVFKKNNRFSLAVFEFVTVGLSKAMERGGDLSDEWIQEKLATALLLPEMEKYSGSGVRGTQRLSGLVPLAEGHFT